MRGALQGDARGLDYSSYELFSQTGSPVTRGLQGCRLNIV